MTLEVAGSEKGTAYVSLLRSLTDRGLHGVRRAYEKSYPKAVWIFKVGI